MGTKAMCKCKDCKHWNDAMTYKDRKICDKLSMMMTSEDYCSKAETKNGNGADDNGCE